MPASYVHQWLATRAWRQLGQDAPPAPLLAGAEGPDPFFYYRLLVPAANRPISALGGRLHSERTADFLMALLARAGGADDDARAYALGFLTHYAADTTVHPYVYAHAFDRAGCYRSNLHCGLEAAMDTWAYHGEGGRGIPRQMQGVAALSPAQCDGIAAVLTGAVGEAFPEDAPGEAVTRRSFADAVSICRLLHSPSGIKYHLFATLGAWAGQPGLVEAHALSRRLPGGDFGNLARQGWCSPWAPDALRRESLPELYDAAVTRACALLRAAQALWARALSEADMRALLGDQQYDSGLPWQTSGKLTDGNPPPPAMP